MLTANCAVFPVSLPDANDDRLAAARNVGGHGEFDFVKPGVVRLKICLADRRALASDSYRRPGEHCGAVIVRRLAGCYDGIGGTEPGGGDRNQFVGRGGRRRAHRESRCLMDGVGDASRIIERERRTVLNQRDIEWRRVTRFEGGRTERRVDGRLELKRCAAESIKDVGVLPGYGDDCGRIAEVTALNEPDAAGTEIGGAGFIRDIGYGLAERHGREQERKKQRDANHGHHSRGRFAAVSICCLAILYRKRKFAPEISGLIQPLEDNSESGARTMAGCAPVRRRS